MTAKLSLPHLKIDANGRYRYRRRVPDRLRSLLGKTEFIKVLGRTERDAVVEYGPYHRQVESVIEFGKIGASDLTPLMHKERVTAFLKQHGADIDGPGRTEGERHAREELAEDILSKYDRDEETGQYEGVSPSDEAQVMALLGGVGRLVTEPTIVDAFDLYLSEKALSDDFKRKKQVARFRRIEGDALSTFGGNLPITKIKRAHARSLRDRLLTRMKPSSVKREITNLKSVLAFAAREYDLPESTALKGLEYPPAAEAKIELRDPLPQPIVEAMYRELYDEPTLLCQRRSNTKPVGRRKSRPGGRLNAAMTGGPIGPPVMAADRF